MPNVLTDLAADIYKAADTVGREVVGFIPSVTLNAGAQEVAKGDVIRSHFTRKAVVNNSVTPSMTIPEGDDQTVDNKQMTLSKVASVQIPWTGEEMKHVDNGSGFETIYGDQIEQAFRAIVNEIEAHVGTVAYQGASRAVGSAGTTPFAANFDLVADARQILVDNGMSVNDGRVSVVMNTLAGTNLRKLSNLFKVNESGDGGALLRRGTLLDLYGFMLKESAGIARHTKGTGALYDTDLVAGYAKGDTTIHVDTGTGTILAGDVVTFAGDANKYVVNTGFAGDGDGDITIGGPGLREALADGVDVAIGNTYNANVAFHQSAIELAIRPLAKPRGGDAAVDEMIVQDPFSGLPFRISAYRGYNKAMFDITCLYEAKVWKSDAVALILG